MLVSVQGEPRLLTFVANWFRKDRLPHPVPTGEVPAALPHLCVPDTLWGRLPWHWENSSSYSNIGLICHLPPQADPGRWLMRSQGNLGEAGTRSPEKWSVSLPPTQLPSFPHVTKIK